MSNNVDELRESIERRAADSRLPGVAVALVSENQRIILTHGTENVSTGPDIGENTLFSLASCSKAFTAAAFGILVQEGHADFDDPVVKYLPEFTLDTPEFTSFATIRDLLGMRLGLQPLGALSWGRTRKVPHGEMFRRMRYLPRIAVPRTQFIYSNLSYTAVAEVITRASGEPFKEFIRKRMFEPLGLTHTFIEEKPFDLRRGVAAPHVVANGESGPIPENRCGGREGESCQYVSAAEMLIWMERHLRLDEGDGVPVVEDRTLETLHQVQMQSSPSGSNPVEGYCMGWMRGNIDGLQILAHEGGELGASTFAMICPERSIGVSVLINCRATVAVRAIAYELFDRLAGFPARDRYTEFLDLHRAQQAATGQVLDKDFPIDGTTSVDLDACCGEYRSRHSGAVTVSRDGDGLFLEFADIDIFNGRVESKCGEVFCASQTDEYGVLGETSPSDARVRVHPGPKGQGYFESPALGRFDRVN